MLILQVFQFGDQSLPCDLGFFVGTAQARDFFLLVVYLVERLVVLSLELCLLLSDCHEVLPGQLHALLQGVGSLFLNLVVVIQEFIVFLVGLGNLFPG